MRFLKGIHYPHPPRGPGRGLYHLSDAARRARRHNLWKSRLRSDRESLVIKLLIWQSYFDGLPLSQRSLARRLGVWSSYICKVRKQSEEGLEALTKGRRATFDDLEEARRFTDKIREQESGLLARAPQSSHSEKSRAMNADEAIAGTWRIAREEQGKNRRWSGRRVQFTVPVRW
jgi:hypothetical protein